jgi:hypothetical protein
MNELLWRGKPLSEYDKEGLIQIIETLCRKERAASEERQRQISLLAGLRH